MNLISENSWQCGSAGADRMARVVAIGSVRAENTSSDETPHLGSPAEGGPHELIVRASFRLATDKADGRSAVEVMTFFEIVDEPRVGWLPSKQLAGQRARGRTVGREEAGQPAEVLACILG